MWKLRAPCWGSLTASTFPYVTASGWGLRWAFPPSTRSIAETGADGTDLEGITSLPRMIEGVEVGITIRQQPTGSYKVSVRTVTGVDASAICAHLGGGGHKQAAGCELLGSLDNAKAALLTEVEKALCKES